MWSESSGVVQVRLGKDEKKHRKQCDVLFLLTCPVQIALFRRKPSECSELMDCLSPLEKPVSLFYFYRLVLSSVSFEKRIPLNRSEPIDRLVDPFRFYILIANDLNPSREFIYMKNADLSFPKIIPLNPNDFVQKFLFFHQGVYGLHITGKKDGTFRLSSV